MYTEKGWENGWSLDGHPYVASTSHFLTVPNRQSSRAPAWAPRFAYPSAFSGSPASSVGKPKDQDIDLHTLEKSGDPTDPLDPRRLPDAALKALDSLEMAFQSSDSDSLMIAVRELGELFDQSLLGSRAQELLADAPLRKCENLKIAALESEILKRFLKVFRQHPERTKEFVQSGLPDQLLKPLQRHRMTRVAREMTSSTISSPKGLSSNSKSSTRRGPPATSELPPYAATQPARAVTPFHLSNKDEAQLSQAVLKLPWSGNQQWERRWEQVPRA